MKTIKETKKLVSVFLCYVLFIPAVVSCVKDSGDYEVSPDNELISYNFTEAINIINNSSPNFKEIFRNSSYQRNTELQLTQQMIDELAIEFGFEEGFVTVEIVETIIEQQAIMEDVGIATYLDSVDTYDDYTKTTLLEMALTEDLVDFEDDYDFQTLPTIEQDILLTTHSFEESVLDSNFDNISRSANNWSPEWSTSSFLAGVLVYGLFGSATVLSFGAAGLVGVLVYNIVGWIAKT